RQPPRLQNHGLPRGPQTPPVQQHLRIWVDFPDPVGASITILRLPARIASSSGPRISSMGKLVTIEKE
ncbi:MAG: hypothetical protein EBT77_02550, partial [Verrucomicrobia bacterium]|nr:hypothetical protein [Verrucomicrobiota bacterium]